MIKFSSPRQLREVGRILADLPYDANTRIATTNTYTIVISNRTEIIEVRSNGDVNR